MLSETVRQSWETPGGNVVVHLAESVLPGIAERAYEAYKSLPRRGVEIGGVLVGRFEETAGGRCEVVVEVYEPVACEHRWGPSYIYSEADTAGLMAVLQRWEQLGSHLRVVGYFRSHTRPGLRLEETDLELLERHFADPRAVALIVRPGPAREVTATFFPRENGWCAGEGGEPRLRVALSPLNSSAAEAPPAQPLVRPDPPRQLAEFRPAQLPLAPHPQLPRAFQRVHGWPGRVAMAAGLLAVLAVLLAGFRLASQRRVTRGAPAPDSLGLTVSIDSTAARVGWSRSRVARLGATHGRLLITDNGAQRILELDGEQVMDGSVVFVPRGDDVVFRLQLYAGTAAVASESVRLVGGERTSAGPAEAETALPKPPAAAPRPLLAQQQQPPPIAPVAGQRTEPAPEEVQTESEVQPSPPPARLPMLSRNPQPVSLSEAPPEVAADGPKLPALPAVQNALPRPESAAPAPPPPAAVTSIVSYVPPKPRASPRPVVPDSLRRAIPPESTISLRLEIDAAGRVARITHAAVYNGTARYLATLSEAAVRNWVFTPAFQNGQPVAGVYEVQFRFVR